MAVVRFVCGGDVRYTTTNAPLRFFFGLQRAGGTRQREVHAVLRDTVSHTIGNAHQCAHTHAHTNSHRNAHTHTHFTSGARSALRVGHYRYKSTLPLCAHTHTHVHKHAHAYTYARRREPKRAMGRRQLSADTKRAPTDAEGPRHVQSEFFRLLAVVFPFPKNRRLLCCPLPTTLLLLFMGKPKNFETQTLLDDTRSGRFLPSASVFVVAF